MSYRMGHVNGGLDATADYFKACLLDYGEKCYAAGKEEAAKMIDDAVCIDCCIEYGASEEAFKNRLPRCGQEDQGAKE